MDADMIFGLITCAVGALCWLLWLVGYIVDRRKHKHKVIAEQNKAIERVRRRETKIRQQRTFLECYLYGIDVDTSKFKNSDYVIFSLRIKEN